VKIHKDHIKSKPNLQVKI